MNGVTIIETDKLNAIIANMERMVAYVRDAAQETKLGKKAYLSLSETAEFTGYSVKWVRNNKDEIGCSKVGGDYRFKRTDVIEFMEQNYFKAQNRRRAS